MTFSGDKLLGGPQAGIIAGREAAIEACRAASARARAAHRPAQPRRARGDAPPVPRPARAVAEIPALRALLEPVETVRARAERLAARIGGNVVESVGRVGGGALPLAELASFAVALPGDAEACRPRCARASHR